jgi:hypothetical protein
MKLKWTEVALNELTNEWIRQVPSAINAAIKRFESDLQQLPPETIGESRSRLFERVAIYHPLSFMFTIEFEDRELVAMVQHLIHVP